MQHAFNQLLQFLQQGIAAIFHFVQMIWTWSVDQISALLAVPWQQWPLWKLVAVIWALYRAAYRWTVPAGVGLLAGAVVN
jgi:hypothetical protein